MSDIALTLDEVVHKVETVLAQGFKRHCNVYWEKTKLVVAIEGTMKMLVWQFEFRGKESIDAFVRYVIESVSTDYVNTVGSWTRPERDPRESIDPHF